MITWGCPFDQGGCGSDTRRCLLLNLALRPTRDKRAQKDLLSLALIGWKGLAGLNVFLGGGTNNEMTLWWKDRAALRNHIWVSDGKRTMVESKWL
jgi:hypothetical protein